jgi:hypothetical protein
MAEPPATASSEKVWNDAYANDPPAEAAKGQPTLVGEWVKIALGLYATVKTAVTLPFQLVPTLAVFLLALLAIGVFIAFGYLLFYLLSRQHPRTLMLSHAAPLDRWTGQYVSRLVTLVRDVARSEGSARGVDSEAVRRHARALASQGADLERGLRTYVKYYRSLRSFDSWISRMDLRENAGEFSVGGDLSKEMLGEFNRKVAEPMEALEEAVRRASRALAARADPRDDTQAGFELASNVHTLHMLLGYMEDVARMHALQRPKKTAIWTVYYQPYVSDLFKHRVGDQLKNGGSNFMNTSNSFMRWWQDLGQKVAAIPCKTAYQGSPKDQARCERRREGFGERFSSFMSARLLADESSPARRRLPEEESLDDVTEQFLGGLKRVFSQVGEFFKNMGHVFSTIGKLFVQFPKDPFGTIIKFLSIVIGTVIGIVVVIIYFLLSVTYVIWSPLAVGVYAFVWPIVMAVFLAHYAAVLAVPFFVMWIPDMMTNGFVVNMMRCQNLPTAWEDEPGFAQGNRYERVGGLICAGPCTAGYRVVSGGYMCRKQPGYLPAFCPQQQIYRIFSGKDLHQPYVFDRYKAQPGFGQKTLAARQRAIVDAHQQKVRMYRDCFNALEPFDFMNRHICANIKRAVEMRGLSDEQASQLAVLCNECYCKYEPGGPSGARRWPGYGDARARAANVMCSAIGADKAGEAPPEGGDATLQILRRLIMLGILTTTVLILFYSMLNASDHMVAEAVRRSTALSSALSMLTASRSG